MKKELSWKGIRTNDMSKDRKYDCRLFIAILPYFTFIRLTSLTHMLLLLIEALTPLRETSVIDVAFSPSSELPQIE